jgi:hypothetical protein
VIDKQIATTFKPTLVPCLSIAEKAPKNFLQLLVLINKFFIFVAHPARPKPFQRPIL